MADGSRVRVTDRDIAAQLRQERSATLTRLRQARIEAVAAVAAKVGDGRIRREFEAREREIEAAIRRFWKRIRIKVERKRRPSKAKTDRARAAPASRPIHIRTPSALARRDAHGREGIMLRIRYVRAGGKHAKPGCLRRHWHYIAREAAVTLDSDGRAVLCSNLGGTIEDVSDGLGVQEQVLRAMRKNAKLGFRMIGAFPYGFSPDARRVALARIGEELFGARGLPWSAAAHDSDPDAVSDNPHFHLDYGLLPMERQDDGSFLVSNELRTDLDGQEGLRFIRHTVARVLTDVAHQQGLNRTFTALSYRDRGMDREGGEHVGPEGTAASRRGEHAASVARNEARKRRDEARVRARLARERLEALEQLKRAIVEDAALAAPAIPAVDVSLQPISVAPAPTFEAPPQLREEAGVLPSPGITAPDLASMSLVTIERDAPQMLAPPPGAWALPSQADAGLPVPSMSAVAAPVDKFPSPPSLRSSPPDASDVAMPPLLSATGPAAPIFDAPPRHDAGTSAPEIGAPPVMVVLGEAAPTMAHIPSSGYSIGEEAPRLAGFNFVLWDVGYDITNDEEDDRIEAELRTVVQREAERRREAALAKPLNPFDYVAGDLIQQEFEELLGLIEKQPEMLTVHEGQIFPGDALPMHLRKAMHGYALHPRARATMINVMKREGYLAKRNPVRSSSSAVTRSSVARITPDEWER